MAEPVNSQAAPCPRLNTYHHPTKYYIHLVEVEVDEVEIGQWCEQVFRWSLMVIIGGRPPDDISVTLL